MIRAVVPILWTSLTTKHPAYKNEQEIRLIAISIRTQIDSHIKIRIRGSELVPYISVPVPKLRQNTTRIVVGPAAAPTAEDGVNHLLRSLNIDTNGIITRSTIPYRT